MRVVVVIAPDRGAANEVDVDESDNLPCEERGPNCTNEGKKEDVSHLDPNLECCRLGKCERMNVRSTCYGSRFFFLLLVVVSTVHQI